MAGIGAVVQPPLRMLERQRGHLFPFLPVGLGIGTGLWFALPADPRGVDYGLVLLALACCAVALPFTSAGRPLVLMLASVLCGVLACGARVELVSAPVLSERYYGPVTGRVVDVDRSQAGALRVTLDRVWLTGVPPPESPARVRISLQEGAVLHDPVPGDVVMVTAHLDAPGGAVEPGGFDFRRMAFFDALGAVGYARTPLLLWDEAAEGEARVGRLRAHLSAAIRGAIAGDAGAFAAGVLTGDRSGLSVDAVADLRDSSLAHLLAISGMNMAFLVGFTFGLLRYGLALVPPVALRVDSKKVAAAVSLAVACFYLLLSGANVATERAFIMVAVMLVAVLLDRRAITLRSVAIAGMILLLWQPEALLSPGFQMSFAATVALIAGFAAVNDRMLRRGVPWLARIGVTVVLASVIGGFATAPYAAAHFNRFTDYGLLANLLTGPVMGLVVMPAGAMAALLAPFGLAAPALWVMEQGCRWILFIADRIAGLDGAVTAIPAPPPQVLPVLTLGLVWLVLWGGRGRWLGLVPVMAAMALWTTAERPVLLVAEGGLIGVGGPEGRALSRARGEGFTARNWLENDGDLATQEEASARAGFAETGAGLVFGFAGRSGLLVRKGDPLPAGCGGHDLVVAPQGGVADDTCLWLTDDILRATGTLAFYPTAQGVTVVSTHGTARIWSVPARHVLWPGDQ